MAVNQTSTITTTGTWSSQADAIANIASTGGNPPVLSFIEDKVANGDLTQTRSFNGTNKLTMERVWTDEAWAEYLNQETGQAALEAEGWTIAETNDAP